MSARQILVVDDERIVAAGIKHELEDFGYTVTGLASSADNAVEQAVRGKPDLVLMDIHLKGERDGIEAAREIRDRCGIPVVYLSAFADPETIARAGATEAYGYLLKPYEERELQTTIEIALAKHQSEHRLVETERWLAAILAGIDDAVIATDPENRIHFMNLAAEALTGWRKNEAVGRTLAEVCPLRGQIGSLALDEVADITVSESREVKLPSPARLVDRTGREKPVAGSLSPIFDLRGEFLGLALTLWDINDRPRARADTPAKAAIPQIPKPRGSTPTVLLAEAERTVLDFARLTLEGQGYRVLVAEDGVQAVELFRDSPERIDVAIIDLNIPRLSADAVLARLLELDSDVGVYFSSDYFAEGGCEAGSHLLGVISKPYSRQELVRMVRLALARRERGDRA